MLEVPASNLEQAMKDPELIRGFPQSPGKYWRSTSH